MIAAWMVFSIITGCALTMAATAADRFASLGRHPRRFIWVVAMVCTTCWPAITLIRAALFPLRGPSSAGLFPVFGAHRLSAFVVSAPAWGVSPPWGAVIVLAWGLLSAGLIARLVLAVRYIRRHQATWRSIEIDGMNVHVATDAGPAVIGLHPMHVVLPEWVLGMDPAPRALILRHEAEHRAARDPYLLLTATLLTALLPWNLPLWFQARRLRIAIEIDCDTRVLHAHPRWREYAHLLLTIAQRQAGTTRPLAPALSEAPSNLERRITAMRKTPALSPFHAACLSLAATAAFALACAVDRPQSPDRSSQSTANQGTRVGSAQSLGPTGTTFFEFQVDKPVVARGTLRLRYPAGMRGSGISGELLAQFVVDENGRVDMRTFKALKSPGPEFTAAVNAALTTWQFDPASVRGQKVKQLVQQAFIFRLPPDA
jgi:TonB family protein